MLPILVDEIGRNVFAKGSVAIHSTRVVCNILQGCFLPYHYVKSTYYAMPLRVQTKYLDVILEKLKNGFILEP